MKRSIDVDWKQEVLAGLFIAMETAWLAAVLLFFDRLFAGEGLPRSVVWPAALYPAAYILIRPLSLAQPPPTWRWAAGPIILAILLVGTLHLLVPGGLLRPLLEWSLPDWSAVEWKRAVVVAVGGGFAGLRGWILAGRRVDLPGFVTAFQVGLVVLMIVAVLAVQAPLPVPSAVGLVLAFFAAALPGLWLARSLTIADPGLPAGRLPWAVMAAGAMALILVAGLAVWAVLDRDVLELLLKPCLWVWRRMVDLIDWVIRFLAGLWPGGDAPPELALPEAQIPPMATSDWTAFSKWSAVVRLVAKYVSVTAWTLLVVVALSRALQDLARWLRRKMEPTAGVVLESAETAFWADLWALLMLLVGFLIRLGRRIVRPRRSVTAVSREAASIRDVYRRLLAWAGARGLSRSPDQTPGEFLVVLERTMPACQDDLAFITRLYVRSRYGPLPPDPEDLRRVRDAWRRIRADRSPQIKTVDLKS